MGDEGRLLSVAFPRRRLRRKSKKNKLLEDVQRARPMSWKKDSIGMNVARSSQRGSLIALGWKRKFRVGNRVSGGKESSFLSQLILHSLFLHFPLLNPAS